ncbi:cupin domain-containing protein [Flexivirga caeni]|uniref:cupin domain-containing protein n=1 Tax=Flexivirga caeni TaxID=2294115 RepID=UPI001FE8E6AA|nr:cupin domain-containing protein [Flexivirga caeni]
MPTYPSDPIPADPKELGLQPHPEGGWFRETWRHPETVETPYGTRALATSVLFLLRPGEISAWHRVRSAELWIWQGGGPVHLTLGGTGAGPEETGVVTLGPGGQHVVAADEWQSAIPADPQRATLAACVVSPGFDFADFSLYC